MSNPSPGLYLASSGSYPRTGDAPEFQNLAQTLEAFERAERSAADVLDAQNGVTRRVIAEQVQAGVEVVTDGQVRWTDPVSHIAAQLENVRVEGAADFPGTMMRFRQPVLTGRPVRLRDLVVSDYSFARNALGRLPTPIPLAGRLKVKPVLTGPYTLAKCSSFEAAAAAAAGNGSAQGAHAGLGTPEAAAEAQAVEAMAQSLASVEARALAFTEVIAAEVLALAQAGAQMIQIDEPAALDTPEDWLIFKRSIAVLAEAGDSAAKAGRRAELVLHVCYQDCTPLYERLLALPVDVLGLDLASSPKLAEMIATAGSPMALALGIVDGRCSSLEDAAPAARLVERMLARIEGGRAYLAPSCGLAMLSREHAYAKLELLSKIRAAVNGA